MSRVTADRFVEIKSKVTAECKRRAYSGSISSYGGTAYDYTVTPAKDKVILAEHKDKIITQLNAINSDDVNTATGQTVVMDDDLLAMEALYTDYSKRTKTDHTGTDCRSGCTGMCYGCQGTCYDACTSCTGSCSDTCTGTCSGGCSGSCSGGCSGCGGCGGCSGGCSGCEGTCSGGCVGCGVGCGWDCCAGGCPV